jgi:hypothetical protein
MGGALRERYRHGLTVNQFHQVTIFLKTRYVTSFFAPNLPSQALSVAPEIYNTYLKNTNGLLRNSRSAAFGMNALYISLNFSGLSFMSVENHNKGGTALVLYQTGGRVTAARDYAVAQADVRGAVQQAGRTEHLWGNRYRSRVLEGEPPEGAAAVDWEAVEAAAEPPTAAGIRRRRKRTGVRPHQAGTGVETPFSPKIPPPRRLSPRVRHTKASS